MPSTRNAPGWVLTSGYVEEELGLLKSGKEAGCFLVRRQADERFCLLVRKDYRKRADRDYSTPVLAGERAIRRDTYAAASTIRGGRERRAAAKGTRFGRQLLEHAWSVREYETLKTLWTAGARVPYPVSADEHHVVMQYVGTPSSAAPKLAETAPDRASASALLEAIVFELAVLAREGIVHADLSAYNVLVQHGKPWLIDFPQAIPLLEHPNGAELFARDVANLCAWFRKRGVDANADRLASDLLAEARP